MSQAESSTDVSRVEPIVAQRLPHPSSPTRWGIGFIAVTAIFLGGVYIGQDFLVDRPYNAGLYIEPEYLNLGEVWAEEAFKWRIPIQNISDREVGIAEFTASCQCGMIEPPSLTIPPHSTAEVVATIDLTVGRDSDLAEPRRKFNIAIHPIVAVATSRPPGFVLKGSAKDAFTCSPHAVELGEILSRTAGEPKTIRLTAAAPFSSVAALRQPDMEVEIAPVEPELADHPTIRPSDDATTARPSDDSSIRPSDHGTEYLLTVTPSDQIPLGKIDRTILLQAIDAEGRKLPDFSVKVTGEVVFDVAVEPREVYAGVIEMDSSYETVLTLRSRTGTRFALLPAEQEPGVTLEPVTPLPSGERSGEGRVVPNDSAAGSPDESGSAIDPFQADDGLPQASFRLRFMSQSRGDQRTVARLDAVNLATGEQAALQIPIMYYGAKSNPIPPAHVLELPRVEPTKP